MTNFTICSHLFSGASALWFFGTMAKIELYSIPIADNSKSIWIFGMPIIRVFDCWIQEEGEMLDSK